MTPEEQAALDAAQEKSIRELATQITQMTKLGFDPLTIRKGIVAGVNDATTPPTVSINISGDTGTLVSQVRTLNNYTPLVNQTVLVAKQGAEIFLLGSIASINPTGVTIGQEASSGWVKATLSNGTHNANGNGDVYYRRIMDHGSWKMQWRGGWAPAGSTTMISALDTDYRPASSRSVAAARDHGGGSNIVKLDFLSSGAVNLVGGTTGPAIANTNPGTSSVGDIGISTGGALDGYLSSGGSNLLHYHSGYTTSHSHTVNNHSHGGAATVEAPTWVSLNGVEYFL